MGDGMGSGLKEWIVDALGEYDAQYGPYADELADGVLDKLTSAGWFLVRTGEGGEMTTYSDPDGDLVMGEFAFVTELEWFENDDDPTPLRRQRWVCVADDDGAYWPRGRMKCGRCGNDGAGCADCGGTGKNPTADAGFVPASPAARPSGEPG